MSGEIEIFLRSEERSWKCPICEREIQIERPPEYKMVEYEDNIRMAIIHGQMSRYKQLWDVINHISLHIKQMEFKL